MFNKLAQWVLLSIAYLLAFPSFAYTSSCLNGAFPGADTQVGYATFGTVQVSSTAPIGSILATRTIPASGPIIQCTAGTYAIGYKMLFTTHWADNIYQTNIAGLGVRVTTASGHVFTYPTTYDTRTASSTITMSNDDPITVELIKIGPISAGVLQYPANALAHILVNSSRTAGSDYLGFAPRFSGDTTIVQPACEVKTSNIVVPLGKHRKGTMGAIGASTAKQPFIIPLTCSMSSSIKITMNGTVATNTTATQGVLKLDDSGTTAVGVGVQLLKGDGITPVALGSQVTYGTTSAAGDYNVDLYARYYQTQSTIGVGTANATATFTVSYN
ncbi:fimbrial protein [Aeromonas sp. V90_14]|uniref:fimbrial protein n=1 Tax=Aeromonas TaxID=642 RepID=UPI00249F7DD0|nr:fimbrial protein [Aeromonas sp. V90_14]MDI3430279.1 fimbrial protein [Aeromonas sp. V90_14]WVM44255.1 fimbrial protein [Aeromonas hydrophila]